MVELPNHLFNLLKEARKRDWEHDSPSKSPPDKVGSTPENKTQKEKEIWGIEVLHGACLHKHSCHLRESKRQFILKSNMSGYDPGTWI